MNLRRPLFLLFCAIALPAITLLISCGAKAPVQENAQARAATAAATIAQTLAGTITLYTAGPEGLSKDLADAFSSMTGVKVSLFQGDTGSVLAKLDAEKGNPHADVVILADWSGALGLADQGLLQAYLPKNGDKVPSAYRDSANRFVSQGITGLGIVVNAKSVKSSPTTVAQLAGPDWKNLVTMPDPAQSGSVYGILAAELQKLGDNNGWQLFQGLKRNGIQVLGTNAKALDPVLAGSKNAVLDAADYIALGSIAKGEALRVIYPSDGTVVAPRPMMVLKSAPNPVAAKAFEDFVLSDSGQGLVAKTLILPARSDIAPDPSRQPLEALHPLPVDWTRAVAAQTDALTRFANDITH